MKKDYCKNCNEEIPINHAQVGGVHMTCEHEYFKQKRLYFQIADQCDEKNKCTVEEKELTSHLADADEAYLVNPIQMTRHEFYSLPEFTGF